ncbi:Pyruvate kinase cytosolic isozyme [Nymphaea thermarum]|nr:Pyruvate kinase cytosolic isozyme [Nymphaea thermarum]
MQQTGVLSCHPDKGTVRRRCENTAVLGERKNENLPGIVVDLPTLREKDKEDILKWGVPNKIDMIALSFVRKGLIFVHVRLVRGPHARPVLKKITNSHNSIFNANHRQRPLEIGKEIKIHIEQETFWQSNCLKPLIVYVESCYTRNCIVKEYPMDGPIHEGLTDPWLVGNGNRSIEVPPRAINADGE